MRFLLAGALVLLSGCGPSLVFNSSPQMSREEMLDRASLVFIGMIQKQEYDSGPFLRWSGGRKLLRREVRIETVLRGTESRKIVDVYEVLSGLGTSGDGNNTQDGARYLFLVRVENARYRVVRDSSRSIFPVTAGPHLRLPLDDSHALWERIALMNFWIERADDKARISYPYFRYHDPAGALSVWRKVKLERGRLRHPSAGVRVPACHELLMLEGWGQDECWEMLSDDERAHLTDGGFSAVNITAIRDSWRLHNPPWWWSTYSDREMRRLLTAVNDRPARTEFCRLYTLEYPGDPDTGCPADQPPPATIVTERGDVPLIGPWPR